MGNMVWRLAERYGAQIVQFIVSIVLARILMPEIYGTIAAEKLIQTYAAIINSALTEQDFLGELSNGEFLLITTPEKSEKIAAYLVFAFDSDVVANADGINVFKRNHRFSKNVTFYHLFVCDNDADARVQTGERFYQNRSSGNEKGEASVIF